MKTETTLSRPVRIVVIGAGNRAHKYLEYARRNPEQLRLAAIVEVNDLRRRAMADRQRELAEGGLSASRDETQVIGSMPTRRSLRLLRTPISTRP